MKKIVSLMLLSAATLALHAAAKIPQNSVVYLDVTQAWCCKATYAVLTSGSDVTRIMKPVEGKSGVYSYTVTMSGGMQENFQFGYSNDVVITRDRPGWDDIDKHKEPSGNWSASKPYYIVTGSDGSGYWASAPTSSGATALDSVVVSTPNSCIDSTYDVIVSVYFSGAPCSMRLTGDQWTSDVTKKDLKSPVVIKQEDIKEPAGKPHSVTVTLYSATNYTGVIGSMQAAYVSPEIECEVETDLGDKCINEPMTLTTTTEGAVYKWSTGATERSITVTPTEGAQTYTAEVYETVYIVEYNMMANGDFETKPEDGQPLAGFESDYFYAGWDSVNYYTKHPGKSNLYAITQDASVFWHDFAPIQPHGGQYFALFDATYGAYAWKASTKINPSLKLQKDSMYVFSYWVAYPNKEKGKNPAILLFEISYQDANGIWQTAEHLGDACRLSEIPADELNDWHQQTATWIAPCDADSVVIAVRDINNTSEYIGNDFCLDDIMFQKASVTNLLLARREIYHVNGIDCGTPPPDPPCTDDWLRTKWNDVLFVDNSAGEFVGYQWYVNGEEIAGATEQYYRASQDLTQSTDLYSVHMRKADGTTIISCEKTFGQVSPSRDQYPAPEPKQVVFRRYHVIGSHFRIVVTGYDDGSVEADKELY